MPDGFGRAGSTPLRPLPRPASGYEFGDSLLERITEPVASRYNERQFRNSLRATKELVEAEPVADPEPTIEA